MSVRPNAPYRDKVLDDGTTLIYEGHDLPKITPGIDPKSTDQPERTSAGTLTQNGKFHEAAQQAKEGRRSPERVRVYEKIRTGIWADNGLFDLLDSWTEHDGRRNVFKFKLAAIEEEIDPAGSRTLYEHAQRRRIIPTAVKLEVWKRDGGKCVRCASTDELHFDHIIPYTRGGTSLSADNIQLLCARHNIAKSDRIE
jgi:5-methylcytosine-specific restriction endonuclease McrA